MCIYQYSSFLSDIVVTLIGSFFGVYLAIIVSRIQENRRNKDLLIHFSRMLDDIVSSTKKQKDNVVELSENLKKNPLDIHLIGLIATFDFERIKSVDSNLLYKTYNHTYKNSIDEFRKTFAYIDYLTIKTKEFNSSNEKHVNFTHKDQIFVRDQIEILIYKIGMYVSHIQQNDNNYSNNPDYIFLSPYMERLKELTRTTANNLSIFETEILSPLNNKLLHELENIEVREELFHIVKQSKNKLDSIRYNSIEFAKDLITDFDIIEKAVNHIDYISGKIKKI